VGRCAGQSRDRLLRGDLGQQAVLRVVDQLGLLALLDGLDRQAQLLGDLVMRAGVQIRHPGVHVEQGGDGSQGQLAGAGLVVDVGLGQRVFEVLPADLGVDLDTLGVDHAVDAVDAGLDRNPAQQVQQKPRGDGVKLRDGLGGIGQLPCRKSA
jgi:hypothetical protein